MDTKLSCAACANYIKDLQIMANSKTQGMKKMLLGNKTNMKNTLILVTMAESVGHQLHCNP